MLTAGPPFPQAEDRAGELAAQLERATQALKAAERGQQELQASLAAAAGERGALEQRLAEAQQAQQEGEQARRGLQEQLKAAEAQLSQVWRFLESYLVCRCHELQRMGGDTWCPCIQLLGTRECAALPLG